MSLWLQGLFLLQNELYKFSSKMRQGDAQEGQVVRAGQTHGFWIFLLFMLTGALLGGLLGEIIAETPSLAGIAPYLVKKHLIFDMAPVNINLFVIQIKLGFILQPNLISVLGMIIAFILLRRF